MAKAMVMLAPAPAPWTTRHIRRVGSDWASAQPIPAMIKPACAGATRREAAVSVMVGRLISMAKDGRALRKLISRVKAMEARGIRTKSVILWLAALCGGAALRSEERV